jgi:hypothetical protein
MAMYRAFYLLNWIWRFEHFQPTQAQLDVGITRYWDPIVWASGVRRHLLLQPLMGPPHSTPVAKG